MYDKYFVANQFTPGNSKLPKHKGLLFSGATAGTVATSTVHMVTSAGPTLSASLLINSSPYIFPFQVWSVPSLAGGLTAWYIN